MKIENISLKDVLTPIWKAKYIYIISVILFLCLGFFLYKITPKSYDAVIKILPLGSDNKNRQGGLGALANLAGVELNSSNVLLPPSSYEYILKSPLFLANVVQEKISLDGDSVYLSNYLSQSMITSWDDKYNYGFGRKKKILKNVEIKIDSTWSQFDNITISHLPIVKLGGEYGRSIRTLRDAISFKADQGKPIEITVTLQHPEASAEASKFLVIHLERFVRQFQKDNSSENTAFLANEVRKARAQMLSFQDQLAGARDRTVNANKAVAIVNVEKLTLQYEQAKSSFLELSRQLNTLNLQAEKEYYPLFIVTDPPVEQGKDFPTAPRIPLYIFLSIVSGLFFATVLVFLISFTKINLLNK